MFVSARVRLSRAGVTPRVTREIWFYSAQLAVFFSFCSYCKYVVVALFCLLVCCLFVFLVLSFLFVFVVLSVGCVLCVYSYLFLGFVVLILPFGSLNFGCLM